jgi:hypothetical protein
MDNDMSPQEADLQEIRLEIESLDKTARDQVLFLAENLRSFLRKNGAIGYMAFALVGAECAAMPDSMLPAVSH